MFLSSKKVKGHTYWYVLNKKRVAGQSRSFIVEKLREEASLLAKDPDFLKRKETEIAKLNEDLKAEKASVTKIRNPAKKATARTMHAGAFPIFAAMSDIGLYDILNDSLEALITPWIPSTVLWIGSEIRWIPYRVKCVAERRQKIYPSSITTRRTSTSKSKSLMGKGILFLKKRT